MKILSISFDDILSAIKDFFNPTLEGYTNFSFSASQQKMLPLIIFALFFGVFLASFYTLYVRSLLGGIVRKLIHQEIFDPARAKTADELGYGKNLFILHALKSPYSLRRVLRSTELDAHLAEEKSAVDFRPDPKNEHFYLPEDDKYKAEMRFGKSATAPHTILFVLLGIILCEVVVFAFLPELVSFFDNVVSIFSVKGNTIH